MKIHSKGWWFRHYVLCNQSSFSDAIFYIQIASYWFLAFFIDRLVEELKRHHLVVTGEPCPPAEANTEPATSTSEESSSAALGEGNNCDSSRESASSSSPNRKTRSGTAAKSKSESAFDILQKTIAGPKPHRSTSTRPTTSLLECHQEAPDDIADEAPDETQENIKGAKYSAAVKQSMYEKGLYNRHSLDHPLLQAFAMHLNKEKNIQNYKQEVWTIKYFTLFMKTAICTLTKDEATHSWVIEHDVFISRLKMFPGFYILLTTRKHPCSLSIRDRNWMLSSRKSPAWLREHSQITSSPWKDSWVFTRTEPTFIVWMQTSMKSAQNIVVSSHLRWDSWASRQRRRSSEKGLIIVAV